MKFPLPDIERWEEMDRILDWCEMRKFEVRFRSTHHQAATPKSVFMMRKAIAGMRVSSDEYQMANAMKGYEVIFESDDCAIEYRLRFL